MNKLDEYRHHAKECRRLAKQMLSDEQREQMMAMAETWERLVEERETILRIQEEFSSKAEKARTKP